MVAPVVPVMFEFKFTEVAAFEHIFEEEGDGVTTGVGLMVIVNCLAVPAQVEADDKDGVTSMVAVVGAVLVFVAKNPVILPLPLAPRPIPVLVFVHEKVVPVTAPLKVIPVVVSLLQ